MTIVRGKDIDLYVKRSGVFVFTACATNLSIERTADEINITTADSGRENEYMGGATDATGSLDGVITLDEITGWQYEEWVANVGEVVTIRIDFTNSWGDRLRYETDILILSVSAQGDVNDFGAFSVNWKRSGAETVTKIFDNILIDTDDDPILDSDGNLIRV